MAKRLPMFDPALAFKYKKKLEQSNCLQNADAVLFWTPGFVGWGIRVATGAGKTGKNHIGQITDAKKMLITHARGGHGVVTQPLYEYMAENKKIRAYIKRYEITGRTLPKEKIDAIVKYTLSKVGEGYDHPAIAHLCIRSMIKVIPFIGKIPWRLPLYLQNRVQHFCSEIFNDSYRSEPKPKINFSHKHHPSTCTPHDIDKDKRLKLKKELVFELLT